MILLHLKINPDDIELEDGFYQRYENIDIMELVTCRLQSER